MTEPGDADDQWNPEPSDESDLSDALRDGDLRQVAALIEGGADIRYKRKHGYDALLDAVHGRDVGRDPRLVELLALLVAHGVDLSGCTDRGESALRVLARLGRFDGVRLLLDAGADKSHLEWTPLMEAVALGSQAEVQAVLETRPGLEERDWWSRTAWLIALHTGDIGKATLLRDHGADTAARGRCGTPPLFYAIRGHHPHLVRWLLRDGASVHLTDEFGTTALMEAVGQDDLECVEILLGAGADVGTDSNGTALKLAGSPEIIRRLLEAGADPADADQRTLLGLSAEEVDSLGAVSPAEFWAAPTRGFGVSNPQRMRFAFWDAMIRCGAGAYTARKRFEESAYTLAEPVWCAQRYGQSLTFLPDGRAVQVCGEHEDAYDPDFCIYNDVFVHETDGSIAVYGYPEAVFPPTDFHTATLVGDAIFLIGSLGYRGTRRFGETPVYRLDVRTFRIDRLDALGDSPGWVYMHRASEVGRRQIRVWGGKVATEREGGESHDPNRGSFVLDLERLLWHRDPSAAP